MARGGAQRSARSGEAKALEASRLAGGERRMRRMRIFGGIAVVVAAVAAVVVLDPPPPGIAAPVIPPSHIATLDQPHVAYTSTPPSSGAHLGDMVPSGLTLEEPLAPEAYLHFMEDGGIGVFYECDDRCLASIGDVETFISDQRGERLFGAPYEGIRDDTGAAHRFAAVAWGRILYFDDFTQQNIDELEVFVSIYEGLDHHAGR